MRISRLIKKAIYLIFFSCIDNSGTDRAASDLPRPILEHLITKLDVHTTTTITTDETTALTATNLSSMPVANGIRVERAILDYEKHGFSKAADILAANCLGELMIKCSAINCLLQGVSAKSGLGPDWPGWEVYYKLDHLIERSAIINHKKSRVMSTESAKPTRKNKRTDLRIQTNIPTDI